MRSIVIVSAMVALAGCTAANPSAAPTKVSWQYGAGNGDGVSYPGPTPVYKRAYGLESDAVAAPAQEPKVNYGWGAENQAGGMVQTAPQSKQQVASPTSPQQPAPHPDGQTAAPGTHS